MGLSRSRRLEVVLLWAGGLEKRERAPDALSPDSFLRGGVVRLGE